MNSPEDFSGSIRSNVSELSALTDQVEAWGQRHAIPQKQIWSLCVMLDELVTNTIVHGYGNADDQPIAVSIHLGETALELTIRDCAPPFNPFDRPPADTTLGLDERAIGGLGVHFVRRLASSVRHRYDGAANEVQLTIAHKSDDNDDGNRSNTSSVN